MLVGVTTFVFVVEFVLFVIIVVFVVFVEFKIIGVDVVVVVVGTCIELVGWNRSANDKLLSVVNDLPDTIS